MAEEEAKTGRQPASATTENLTAYLPWPFHTVLNSTVSLRPEGKDRRVRTGFKLWRLPSRVYADAATATKGLATRAGERIKDAGDRRDNAAGM